MMVPAPCRVLLICMASLAVPAHAQLEGGGLEKGGGLGGSEGGLRGGSLHSGQLEGGRLKGSSLRGGKLEPSKPAAGGKRLSPATLKRKAMELTKGGLGVKELQGAASTIPPSQVGVLLYDVASLLMLQGPEMKGVAIGYYMGVLADPEGERHDDALQQLKNLFLDRDLEHAEAVRLYDMGLETMKSLVAIRIGLIEEGYRTALLDLQEVKAAYHHRRKKEVDEAPVADQETDALGNPVDDRPVTGNQIDEILKQNISLSDLEREDVKRIEPPAEEEP